jgi:hypothetical protein
MVELSNAAQMCLVGMRICVLQVEAGFLYSMGVAVCSTWNSGGVFLIVAV